MTTTRSSPSSGCARATVSSVTTNLRPSAGWKNPAAISPGPRNTGYSPDEADAHTSRVPSGADSSTWSAGQRAPERVAVAGGSSASATDS